MIPLVTPPPPAYAIVNGVSHRLAQSSYCWRTTCADFVRPRCGDGRTPAVRVGRGTLVRFRLGFEPRSVELSYVGRLMVRYRVRLPARRETTWRARLLTTRDVFVLSARAASGDTSYSVCFTARR